MLSLIAVVPKKISPSALNPNDERQPASPLLTVLTNVSSMQRNVFSITAFISALAVYLSEGHKLIESIDFAIYASGIRFIV